jgi:hypothetical protein
MHKHSKGNFKILKDGVNDPGLAFAGKVGFGPFWTLVQALSYLHVLQLFDNTIVSSFWHERISTVGKIYTKIQMQDLLDDFNLINYNQQMTTMGCMVGHIHIDKNTFNILFQNGQYAVHYHLIFLMVIVYTFI